MSETPDEASEAGEEPEEEPEEPEEEAVTSEETAEESESAEAVSEGIESGDVIRLAFTAYTTEDERVIDTTDEAVAEEADLNTENQTFGPRFIVVGEGHLFEPVDEALIGGEAGDTGEVTVSAEQAFGEVDSEQVRTVSADKIPEDDRYPGAHVDIEGQHGFVETIIGGRARVDFNHPLAGEDIVYEYEIIEVIEDRKEIAQGLLKSMLDVDLEVWFETETITQEAAESEEDEDAEETTEEVESLYIEADPALAMNQQWLFGKQQIATQLIDQVGVDRVVVQEILESRQKVLEDTQQLLSEQDIEEIDESIQAAGEELEGIDDLDVSEELEE